MAVMTLLIAGCSKPEEVISRRVTQANQNLDAGRVDDAVKILERLNQTYIDQPNVLEALGFAYARAGRHGAAATSFVRAADLDPSSSSLRQLAAESYVLDSAPDRAAQQLRLYVGEFPGDYQSREKLGQIEEQSGNLVRANDEYIECYRIRPSGEIAYRLGNVFRQLNNAPQAKAWFETTIKHSEARVEDALLGLLELELSARDFAAAERTMGQLDRIYPGTLDASAFAAARADVTAWKEQHDAINAARAVQEKAAREIETERKRQEAELTSPAAAPASTTPARAETTPDAAPASSPQSQPPAGSPAVHLRPLPMAIRPVDTAVRIAAPEANAISEAPAAAEAPLANPLPEDMVAAAEAKDQGDLDRAIALLWEILASDDQRVDAWTELGDAYRLQRKLGDAESCLLEAARRAPENIEVEIAYLNVVRESQPGDFYFARVEAARRKFPGSADLAYFVARELSSGEGPKGQAVSAYEDFLLLAAPTDPRRAEAASFIARARGY